MPNKIRVTITIHPKSKKNRGISDTYKFDYFEKSIVRVYKE